MKLWYPYTQMKNRPSYPKVIKGKGSVLYLENGAELIDGISSWWACIHGYSYAPLNKTMKKQVDKISHVMLGGLTHEPAEKLAEKLVEITPKGLNHVFFSDSGSVAVEVALKMAIQYWSNQQKFEKTKLISFENGYHGDTFKAMELGDDSDFTVAFSHILHADFKLKIPESNTTKKEIDKYLIEVEQFFKSEYNKIAALIIEPIIQCAGGFKIYSSYYLDRLNVLCKQYEIITIYDEVATGFGRTGKLFASEHCTHAPDILILGKALTGGYIGHAATLTNSKVFERFLGDEHEKAFMHGPTFMANPLACSVALKSIELFQEQDYLKKIKKIEKSILDFFQSIQSETIHDKRVIGAVGIIEVKNEKTLEGFKKFALEEKVFLRPIGKSLYLMPSYRIKKKELKQLLTTIKKWFEKIKG